MFNHYLKIAWRNLAKNKMQNGINILGLSIGITSALVTFLILEHQLNFDAFHSQSNQIFRIVQNTYNNGEINYWSTTAYPLAAALRDDFPKIKTTQSAGPFRRLFTYQNENGELKTFEENEVLFVDEDYLNFFDFQKKHKAENGIWLAGDSESALSEPNSIVLTQSIAERVFDKKEKELNSLIGEIVSLNGKDPLTITGILKNPPNNTSLYFDILVPYSFFKINNPYPSGNWAGNYQGTSFIVLPKNEQPHVFEKKLNDWKKKYLTEADQKRIEYKLQPLSDVHLDTQYDATPGSYTVSKKTLGGLALMSLFLLLIACINFINLATARVSKRAKEVGVSKVLGGTKKQLQLQFLSETALLILVTLGFSFLCTELIVQKISGSFSLADMHLALTPGAWLFGAILFIIVVLAAGWYPAFMLSGLSPMRSFQSNIITPKKRGGVGLRQTLVVAQFSIVYILVIGTLVVGNQMDYFKNMDKGFQQESILTVNIPGGDYTKLDALRSRILSHPNIKDMSYATGIPMTDSEGTYGTDFRLPHESVEESRFTEMKVVDLNYLELYGLKIIAGNRLTQNNKEAEFFNGFIANESLVKRLNMTPEEAIGQQLFINEGDARIVGVVEDFHNNPMQEEVSSCLIFHWGTGFFNEAGIKLNSTQNMDKTLAHIENIWSDVFPQNIFKHKFIDESFEKYYRLESFLFQAFRIFSILSILIGCIGLYGLMSFIAESRTKEIGVRKILGATIFQITAMLSKDFGRLVFISIIISAPFAWWFLSGWLNGFAHRIELDAGIFILGALIALSIPAMTVGWQGLRAALINPVESLRNE